MVKIKLLACVSAVALLAACGGGSGGGSVAAKPGSPEQPKDPSPKDPAPKDPEEPIDTDPKNPPKPDMPDLSTIARMVKFAQAGSVRTRNGVQTWTNIDGSTGVDRVVRVDVLPGFGPGLVTFADGANATVFSLAGKPLVTKATPDGIYAGDIKIDYRMDSGGQWQAMAGDAYMRLNMKTGDVFMDSIAGDDTHTIAALGWAKYKGGRIASDKIQVRINDGNEYLAVDKSGKLDAIVATGDGKSAIFGTVSGKHANGFEMKGGLVLPYAPEHN